uniref:Sialic acid-binding Ig-like lectin 5 n=1 Tax=Geotrypetes seraphini TaxID=260995 RepID=A0A6P8SMM8_GEOSA|nr:sialic acid-binding Ig-like lectin 5 [Geotrypetes seraphini]
MPRTVLLLLIILWRGFLYQVMCRGYDISLPIVRLQRGLCGLIHCTFSYPEDKNLGDNPKGYWYMHSDDPSIHPPVITNDPAVRGTHTEGRFKMVGDLKKDNCSFRIDDVITDDLGQYDFRIVGEFEYYYNWKSANVRIYPLTDKPIVTHSVLYARYQVTFNCTAPGRCIGTPPVITWSGNLEAAHTIENTTTVDEDGLVTHSSRYVFNASFKDYDKILICSVYFPIAKWTVTNETRLYILENPDDTTIKTTSTITFKTAPIKKATIKTTSTITIKTAPIKKATIKTVSTNIDEIASGSGNWKKANCTEKREGISCTCLIRSRPPPELWWLINEEIVIGNFSNRTLQVFSGIYGYKANSTLTLREITANTTDIHCINGNKLKKHLKFFGQLDLETLILIICGSIIFLSLSALTAFCCGKGLVIAKRDTDSSETTNEDESFINTSSQAPSHAPSHAPSLNSSSLLTSSSSLTPSFTPSSSSSSSLFSSSSLTLTTSSSLTPSYSIYSSTTLDVWPTEYDGPPKKL